MSVETQITRLTNAKASIKTAIENKGVTVPSTTKLDGYAALINNIPTDRLYGYEGGLVCNSCSFIAYTSSSEVYCYSPSSINNLVQIGGYLPYNTSGMTIYYRIAKSATTYDYCAFADGEIIKTQVAYTIGYLTGITRSSSTGDTNRTDIPIILIKDSNGYLNIAVKNGTTFTNIVVGNTILLDRIIVIGSSSATSIANFTSYLTKSVQYFYGKGGSTGGIMDDSTYWDKHNLTTAIINSSGYNSSYNYFIIPFFTLQGDSAFTNNLTPAYVKLTYMNNPIRISVTDADESWSGATDSFLVSNGDMTWYEWISKNSPVFDRFSAGKNFTCASTSTQVSCGGVPLSPVVYGSDQVAKYTSYDITAAE